MNETRTLAELMELKRDDHLTMEVLRLNADNDTERRRVEAEQEANQESAAELNPPKG